MGLFWSSKPKAEARSRRVLVVEDSRTQAMELALILRGHQYEPVVVPTAEEALRRVEEGNIEAVLTDIVMPGINGYQLCKFIKENPRLQHIPVVLLTALSDPMDVVHGIRAGADNFFVKPYEAADLIGRLNAMLDRPATPRDRANEVVGDFMLMGERITLTADKGQMFTLLFASFEHYARARRKDEKALQDAKDREARAKKEVLKLYQGFNQIKGSLALLHTGFQAALGVGFRRVSNYLGWLSDDIRGLQNPVSERNHRALNEELERIRGLNQQTYEQISAMQELLLALDRRAVPRPQPPAPIPTGLAAPATPPPSPHGEELRAASQSLRQLRGAAPAR